MVAFGSDKLSSSSPNPPSYQSPSLDHMSLGYPALQRLRYHLDSLFITSIE